MKKKICKECTTLKSTLDFHKKSGGKLGVDSICRKCISFLKKNRRRKKIELAQAKLRKPRKYTYGGEMRSTASFIDIRSPKAAEALDFLLLSIIQSLTRR